MVSTTSLPRRGHTFSIYFCNSSILNMNANWYSINRQRGTIWTLVRSSHWAWCREGSQNSETSIQNLHTISSLISSLESTSTSISPHFDAYVYLPCPLCSNPQIRQHVQTSKSLFPHKRIIRRSEMTARGLVVTEEEEISGLPSSSSSGSPAASTNEEAQARKSPIAELLYMRWLEGLKLKWPSILWTLMLLDPFFFLLSTLCSDFVG